MKEKFKKKTFDNKISKEDQKIFLKNVDNQTDNFSQNKVPEKTKVEQN